MNPKDLVNINRLVIAAPQGRCGKTTITLGLLRAFKRRGLRVQPFKKGPDYIDPSWLSAAAGIACRNLDSYLMEPEQICKSVSMAAPYDLSIIEGAMGLFDGLDLAGSSSTAEIAKITKTAVILVIDATRMTRSAAAIVLGCQHFDPQIQICGVILNKVARPRHEKMLREAIEHFCKIPVLGAIPKDSELSIPDRHLGLITNIETDNSDRLLDYLAEIINKHVDLDQVYALATQTSQLPQSWYTKPLNQTRHKDSQPARIGVMRDKVFSFYYPENISALVNLGGQIVEINSLTDPCLPPDLDALYIGGGFPEVFAADLESNIELRLSIKKAVESSLPIYAECGGLMYLGRTLKVEGRFFAMTGALPFDVVMEPKPQGHGYTLLESLPGNLWYTTGIKVKGHEFHNSRIINLDPRVKFAYKVERGHGIDGVHDGIIYNGVLASYNHLHALGTPQWAVKLVELAKSHKSCKLSMSIGV
ncbi:MAG: cobyrinic acid a,c-diamide synthase [Gracilibacter sp. BRH_c7a]|nr:MAG: cobyrinic acid a,c-diamide synthase [Gracilibacter sp. BRH_c7a]